METGQPSLTTAGKQSHCTNPALFFRLSFNTWSGANNRGETDLPLQSALFRAQSPVGGSGRGAVRVGRFAKIGRIQFWTKVIGVQAQPLQQRNRVGQGS